VGFTGFQDAIHIFAKMPIFGFLIPCPYGRENDGGKDREGGLCFRVAETFD